jgi:hypothetical protein
MCHSINEVGVKMRTRFVVFVAGLALGCVASAQVVLNQIPTLESQSDLTYASQDEPSASAFDIALLDDFTVTAGQTQISLVEVVMSGFAGFTQFSQWNNVTAYRVEFYTNNSGASITGNAGSQLVPAASATITNLNWNTSPHFGTHARISLPVNVNLPGAGTYWVAVMGVVDMGGSSLQVGVAENFAVSGGNNATLINPGGGFGFGNSMNVGINAAYRVTSGSTTVIVNPNDYTVMEGSEQSHNLAAFLLSDDVRHLVSSNTPNSSTTTIEYVGTAPAMTVNRLSFILEHQANDPSRQINIDLWNFTTNQWETVLTTLGTTVDSTHQVNITSNPGRFINASNREMRTRTRLISAVIPRTWPRVSDFYDRAVWELSSQ